MGSVLQSTVLAGKCAQQRCVTKSVLQEQTFMGISIFFPTTACESVRISNSLKQVPPHVLSAYDRLATFPTQLKKPTIVWSSHSRSWVLPSHNSQQAHLIWEGGGTPGLKRG